jgi:hypothetical protein
MKTLIRFYASALAAATSIAAMSPPADAQLPHQTGHVLLLESEGIVEGAIVKEGDKYRIRREAGETVLPAATVLCLCDTMDQAYAFLRSRANLHDADERMRLARWCHLHGLRRQAVTEAEAAVKLRPQSPETQRLLQNFQDTAIVPNPPTVSSAMVGPVPVPPVASAPAIEVNAEALGQFITKVQPVLMNTCINCHQAGHGGPFRLTRALEGGVLNRRATQQNLNAVLEQIDREHPEISPLLLKAVGIHGSASHPPLKSRQTPAYRNLEEWVKGTLASNPLLADRVNAAATVAVLPELKPVPEPGKAQSRENDFASRPTAPVEVVRASGEEKGASPLQQTAAPAPPPKAVEPVDPFDPAVFNQEAPGGKR